MKSNFISTKKWLSTLCILAVVVFIGCNKEIEETKILPESEPVEGITVTDGRLAFNSMANFHALAEEYMNKDSKAPVQLKLNRISALNYQSLQKSYESADAARSMTKSGVEKDDEYDYDLVPDEFFASVLNDKYEIEVEGTIYKVTPYGTFMLRSTKLAELYAILEQEDPAVNLLTNLKSHKFYENKVGDDLFLVADEIYLFDTFRKKGDKTYEVLTYQDYSLDEETGEYQIVKSSVDPYGDLREFNFGYHTIVGGAIQGLFGCNEIHHRSWGDKRRLRVNFYDTNYLVYSALGLSGKFQKKNWIGWSSTECQEMRIGILALKFENWSIPAPKRPANTNYPILNYNTPSPAVNVSNEPFINVDLLGCWNFSVSEGEAAQQSVKRCYDFLKSKLGSSTPPERNLTYTCWVNTDNIKAGFFGGRNESISYNTDGKSYIFSWGTGTISLIFNIGGGWVPGVSGQTAQSIALKEANVFVTAKYDNNWQGIKIKMD